MPRPIGAQKVPFNESYPILGKYRTDDDRIPLFNPEDSGVMYLPGEPVLVERDGEDYVYMCQGRIMPGETGFVVRRFTGEFPADLSADVVFGDGIWWDTDEDKALLEGDVGNGFLLGTASYDYDGHKLPEVDNDGKVICGTETSTNIRVVSLEGPTQTVGTTTTTTAG